MLLLLPLQWLSIRYFNNEPLPSPLLPIKLLSLLLLPLLLLCRSYDSELPFLLNTRSPPIAAPGAAAEAGQAGLHTLLQLLTGDEVQLIIEMMCS